MRETEANETSSRSHLIFRIKIFTTNKYTGENWMGNLSFFDLAGTENIARIGVDALIYKEGISKNESLQSLSNLINTINRLPS